jgi:lysophospholipase L1-like esterase
MPRLGRSDLDVFPLCLGGNVFGWTASEQESFAILDAYAAAGGNFIDTADSYSAWVPGHVGGESETVIGRWMTARGNRTRMIIATKVGRCPGRLGLGAQNILVPGMPDLGLTPYFQGLGPVAAEQASALTDYFNFLLLSGLPSGVHFFDTANLLRSMVANPSAYGLANAADACFNGMTVCANPDEYLFWDEFHPTTVTHSLIAARFEQTVVPEPSAFILVVPGLALLVVAGQRASRKRWPSAVQPFSN